MKEKMKEFVEASMYKLRENIRTITPISENLSLQEIIELKINNLKKEISELEKLLSQVNEINL